VALLVNYASSESAIEVSTTATLRNDPIDCDL